MVSKLNPPRLLHILHLPIKFMRLVTDPLVDFVVFLVNRFVIPRLLDVAKGSANLTLLFVQKLLGKKMAESVLEISNALVSAFMLVVFVQGF
jgi:E3 ubiquitin-protein ligase MARCH6